MHVQILNFSLSWLNETGFRIPQCFFNDDTKKEPGCERAKSKIGPFLHGLILKIRVYAMSYCIARGERNKIPTPRRRRRGLIQYVVHSQTNCRLQSVLCERTLLSSEKNRTAVWNIFLKKETTLHIHLDGGQTNKLSFPLLLMSCTSSTARQGNNSIKR